MTERMWKEAVADTFKVLSWHMPGRTEKSHEKYIQHKEFYLLRYNPEDGGDMFLRNID
jgi:hypothetical protein